MTIRAIIKPNSKKGPLIISKEDERGEFFEIFVREPAVEGRANRATIELLSQKFNTPKTKINLKIGQKSRFKIFEIN